MEGEGNAASITRSLLPTLAKYSRCLEERMEAKKCEGDAIYVIRMGYGMDLIFKRWEDNCGPQIHSYMHFDSRNHGFKNEK